MTLSHQGDELLPVCRSVRGVELCDDELIELGDRHSPMSPHTYSGFIQYVSAVLPPEICKIRILAVDKREQKGLSG